MIVSFVKRVVARGDSSAPETEVESKTTPMMPSGLGFFLLSGSPGGKKTESVDRGTR